MRRKIPEKVEIFCDFCGNKVGLEENTIKLAGNSVENRCAIGPAYRSGTKDCCTSCYTKIYTFMDSLK